MPKNEVSYFGFRRTRGDASRVDSDSKGVPAILVPTGSRDLHIASAADENTDWNVSNPTHPTVYIHSETTPATDYVSVAHDGTAATLTAAGADRITLTGTDVVVDNTYGLIVGHTAQITVSDGDGATDLIPEVQVLGTSQTDAAVLIGCFNTTDATPPMLAFLKSGHATIGSNTTVASGERLGDIVWFGADGTDFESPAAAIRCLADTTTGTGDMPGRLVFLTTADSGETLTEALRLTSAQDVRVNDGGGLIVGSTSAQVTISNGDGATDLIPEVQVLGTTKTDASVLIAAFNTTDNATVAPSLNFLKSGHATIGSNTIVASSEVLGEITFFGADGTDFESPAARIQAVVATTPGVGDMPGQLDFATTSDAGETLTTRLSIGAAGTTTVRDTLSLGLAGTALGVLKFNGNTSGTITVQSAAAAGTYTLTLPPDDGDAGEQLQTDGSGVLTWEAAASLREVKNFLGQLDPAEALRRIVAAPVHLFQYKPEARPTTRDFETVYAGIVADEAPWAMHHGGRIFSPVSAFGHAAAAIQALTARVEGLEARLA